MKKLSKKTWLIIGGVVLVIGVIGSPSEDKTEPVNTTPTPAAIVSQEPTEPTEKAVKFEPTLEDINNLMADITKVKEASDGVIISILPQDVKLLGWGNWDMKVSNSWYNSAEHEKQQFCIQMRDVMQGLVEKHHVVENPHVTLTVYDMVGTKVADYKLFSNDFKILK